MKPAMKKSFLATAAKTAFAFAAALCAAASANAATWYWTGDGGDLNWFTAANWNDAADGKGNAATELASGDSFAFDAFTPSGEVDYNPSGDFNIATITFGTGLTSAVKITGGKITSLDSAVNNNTSYAMEFANEVQFASTINLTTPTKHIIMSGGATGTTLATTFSNLYGDFTLTSDWTVGASYTVKSGSTLTTKKITNNASNSYLMKVEANARLLVNGDFYCTCNANTTPRLLTNNDGVVIVTGTATVAGKNNGGNGQNTSLLANSSSTGIVLANKFSFTYGKSGTNWHHYNIDKIGVGTGGITYNNSARNYPMEFFCTGDWTFNDLSSGGNGLAYDRPSISFHTSDYLTPATGRTITVNKCFDNKGVSSGNKPVFVDGCGKIVFNCDFYRFYGLAAKDTVTVEINNNCKPCNEASTNITMKSGTTLSFPKAGTGTTKELCPIVIESGAKMSFSNLSSSVVPVSAKGLTLPESSSVPLTISGSVLADGVYSLISLTSGTIPDSYTNFVVSGNALGTKTSRLFRSSDKQMLLLAVDVPAETDACIWTGEGDGESFSDAGNWMNGDVPSNGGETIFFPSASGEIVNDIAGFAPASITFLAGSAAVTISGDEAISGITAITNLSAASHTINAPVYFTSGINVKQNAVAFDTIDNSHVTFAGGAYAAAGKTIDSGYSIVVFGRYYFANAAAAPWTATEDAVGKRKAVASNSYLYVPYAGNTTNLRIDSGGVVEVGNLTHNANDSNLSWRNYGTMILTNLTFTGSTDRYMTAWQGMDVATFKFNEATISMSGNWVYFGDRRSASEEVFYVGSGGMKFANYSNTPCFALGSNYAGNKTTIRPWYSDFTIADRSGGSYSLVFYRNVIFCTDDENGIDRTITIDARTRSASSGVAVTVSGSGKVKVNGTYYSGDKDDNPPTVTVTDTATLAIKPGAGLGESAMTVNTGATLEVPESGTAALTGSLALADGSALAFKVGENENAVLGLQTLTLSESGKVTVKLTADSLPALGASYTLTSGAGLTDTSKFELAEGVGGSLSIDGDGELVYNAPAYFYIKISESDAGGFNINPAWFWAHGGLGFADTEKLAADIAQPAPNGYTYLQNYLLGYEPDDPASNLRIDNGGDGGTSGSFTLDCTFNVPDVTPESGKYVVKAKLLSSADGQNFSAVEGVDEKTVSTRGSEETVSFAFTPDFTGGGMFRFFA